MTDAGRKKGNGVFVIDSTVIEVLVAAVAYICFAIFLQRKFSNMSAVYGVQAEMQQKTKELNEMAKANADKEAMLKKQKEITDLLGQSMKNQLKPMLIVLPLFFLTYYVLLPLGFAHQPFPKLTVLSITLTYQTLFFYTVFVLGLVISITLSIFDRKRFMGKRQEQQQTRPASDPARS